MEIANLCKFMLLNGINDFTTASPPGNSSTHLYSDSIYRKPCGQSRLHFLYISKNRSWPLVSPTEH